MHRHKLALLTLLGLAFTAQAQDAPKTNWSQYVPVSTITAEVRKVDGGVVTLRVYYLEAQAAKNSGGNGNRNNGNRNNRGNGRGNQNQLQRLMQQARNSQPRVQYSQEHHDYEVAVFSDTKVIGKVQGTLDEKGRSIPATTANLTPGMIVQAALVRDKSLAANAFTEKDLKARSIAVMGTNPNYKDDPASPPAKKKK